MVINQQVRPWWPFMLFHKDDFGYFSPGADVEQLCVSASRQSGCTHFTFSPWQKSEGAPPLSISLQPSLSRLLLCSSALLQRPAPLFISLLFNPDVVQLWNNRRVCEGGERHRGGEEWARGALLLLFISVWGWLQREVSSGSEAAEYRAASSVKLLEKNQARASTQPARCEADLVTGEIMY